MTEREPEPRWLPPADFGPENPHGWSTPVPPPRPREQLPVKTYTGSLIWSSLAIIVGVVGIVAVQSLKLDAEKLLTGGAYLKPAAYNVLMATSAIVLVVGALVFVYALSMKSRRSE